MRSSPRMAHGFSFQDDSASPYDEGIEQYFPSKRRFDTIQGLDIKGVAGDHLVFEDCPPFHPLSYHLRSTPLLSLSKEIEEAPKNALQSIRL